MIQVTAMLVLPLDRPIPVDGLTNFWSDSRRCAPGLCFVFVVPAAADDPCEGVKGTCIALDEGASATEVQTALIEVPSGGTVAFGAGTFELETDLSLDVDDVTIQGAGMDETILSFKDQKPGAQGLL